MAKKSGGHVAAKAPFDFEAQDISISKLLLDPNNYRFLDGKKFKKKAANRFHEESVQTRLSKSLSSTMSSTNLSTRSSPMATFRWSASSSFLIPRNQAFSWWWRETAGWQR